MRRPHPGSRSPVGRPPVSHRLSVVSRPASQALSLLADSHWTSRAPAMLDSVPGFWNLVRGFRFFCMEMRLTPGPSWQSNTCLSQLSYRVMSCMQTFLREVDHEQGCAACVPTYASADSCRSAPSAPPHLRGHKGKGLLERHAALTEHAAGALLEVAGRTGLSENFHSGCRITQTSACTLTFSIYWCLNLVKLTSKMSFSSVKWGNDRINGRERNEKVHVRCAE